MDQSAVVNLLVICVGLLSLTLVLLVVGAVFAAFQLRKVARRNEELMARVQPLIQTAQETLQAVGPDVRQGAVRFRESADAVVVLCQQIQELLSRANSVVGEGQRQAARIGGLVDESVHRAQAQMDRVEDVVADTLDRYQQLAESIRVGLIRPAREISGVFAGLHSALSVLLGKQRTNVSEATQDDEMFI